MNNFFKNSAVLLSFTLILPLATNCYADMEITNTSGEKTYIKNTITKNVNEGGVMIFDHKNDQITLFDEKHNYYGQGSSVDLCQSFSPFTEFTKAFSQHKRPDKPIVEIVSQGSGGKIAGFETTLYKIIENKEVVQYLWLTTDKKILAETASARKEIDNFDVCMSSSFGGVENQYSDSDNYKALMKTAVELKSFSGSAIYAYENDEVINTTQHSEEDEVNVVASIGFDSLLATTFSVPSGYNKLTITEYMQRKFSEGAQSMGALPIENETTAHKVETHDHQETLLNKSKQQVQDKITETPSKVENAIEKKVENTIEKKIEEKLTEYLPSWLTD